MAQLRRPTQQHVCGVDRAGRFALIRIPSVKSCRKFLARTREWILKHRHWRRWEQQEHLTKMLRGFYQYFGRHHCERKLKWVRQPVQRQWISKHQRRRQLLASCRLRASSNLARWVGEACGYGMLRCRAKVVTVESFFSVDRWCFPPLAQCGNGWYRVHTLISASCKAAIG